MNRKQLTKAKWFRVEFYLGIDESEDIPADPGDFWRWLISGQQLIAGLVRHPAEGPGENIDER